MPSLVLHQSFLEGTKLIPAFSLGGIGRTSRSTAMSFGGSVRGTGKAPPRSMVEQEDTRSAPTSIVSFCFIINKKDSLSFHYREKQRKPAMKGPRESVVYECYLAAKSHGSIPINTSF